ncbi:hypothetical protein J3P89_14875 [Pseudomonas sp. Z1-14]|uniref:hypothetical protein n=1 Tax=Pseudomonas sp. Z1-14 TaxID=2817409 RepID=UPI003DA88D64
MCWADAYIHGGGGNDTLSGGAGANQLYGDAGMTRSWSRPARRVRHRVFASSITGKKSGHLPDGRTAFVWAFPLAGLPT